MEDQHKTISSTPPEDHQDSEFKFGCLTMQESPTTDPYKNSPADHLFYNGKLLPHSFPIPLQPPPHPTRSRTSSSSSKDSLMSSRSNSVNSSRSSSSSSSSSTSTDQRLRKYGSVSSSSTSTTPMASKLVMGQLYGSSQRWQHIIVPLPLPAAVLKRDHSISKRSNCNGSGGTTLMPKNGKNNNNNNKKSSGFCLRFLKSLLLKCRQCHAMEPPTSDHILQ